jgi:hypothetical protein
MRSRKGRSAMEIVASAVRSRHARKTRGASSIHLVSAASGRLALPLVPRNEDGRRRRAFSFFQSTNVLYL